MPGTPRKRLLAAAALLAATATLAACGDDTTPPRTPATAGNHEITRAAYIDAADALCARVHATSRAANAELTRTVRRAPTAAAALERIAPILTRAGGDWEVALHQFRAIAPPPADRAEIAHYQAGIEANRVLLGRVARAARAGDLAAYEALVARQDELTRRNRRYAQSYGFRECGRL